MCAAEMHRYFLSKKEFISVVSISYELLLIVFPCVYLNTDIYFSVTSPTRSDPNSHLT